VFEHPVGSLDDSHQEPRRQCRQAVAGGQVHFVGHYSNNVYDFAFDTLAKVRPDIRADPAGGRPDNRPLDRLREDLRRVGRQLGHQLSILDGSLEDLRCGRLIRIVLHGEDGVVFCNSIVPHQYIVGLVRDRPPRDRPDRPLTDRPPVRAADIALARLSTSLRRLVSLGPLNPGGWLRPEPLEPAGPPPDAGPGAPTPPHVEGAGTDALPAALLARTVRPDDLHYLAHWRDGTRSGAADQLDHPRLSRFFTQITPGTRRKLYADLGRQLPTVARQLGRLANPVIGFGLTRIVLDVEEGAVFFYRLSEQDALVGVTLDQAQVSDADHRLAELAAAHRAR
jgi:hypothetical protein